MKLKQGFKRFMSSFLAVALTFSLMPTTVFGATSENAKASGSTTKQYPSYLTLDATNYSKSGSALYHSTQPSIGTAYFHRFRMTGSDGVLYNGFCTDHTKRMSSSLKGTWKPNGTVYGPYDPYGDASHRWAALPWLDYYEFHYQKEGATWSDWTYKWVNAWVQASVWLAVSGEITNVYYSDFNTAEQNAAAMKDIDKLVYERMQALKYCGATDTYEQSAAWLKYTPYGVFKNENYTVNGYKYGNLQWVEYDYYDTKGNKDASVQPILIPVKAAEVKENPVYFTLRKTDTADPTKDLSAAFGVYADEACTKFLENYSASPGNYTFSVNLPDGQKSITIYLKEAQAPNGYMKSSNVYRVTLDAYCTDKAPKPVDEVNDGTGWKPMDTVGVATNDSSANADSYVIFNWNIPGTKSIRSNGMHDKSIGEGALYFETSDNTNLNANGIPNMELLERCQGSVDGVGTPTVGDNYVQWTLKNGTIKFVWQGWYTEPSGGTRVTEAMTYPTYGDDHSQDTASEPVTYYGQWRVETNIKPTDNPDSGTASVDGNFFTVYWDYQSNIGKGGGATACLVGKVTIRVLTAISSGGEYPVNPTFKDYTIEAAFSVPDDPANAGYKFKGWCLGDVTGKGTLYQSSDAQVMAGLVSAGSTFFAIWEPEKINVSYDANGGTGAPGSQTFTYDKAGKLSEQQPTRTGYDFMGWSYTPTTSDYGVVFSAGDSLSAETVDGMYTMGQNVTLYAVWAPQRVIITWTNTQYSKDFSQSTEYKYGDKLSYIGDLTNTEGYDFTGWLSDGGVQAADGMDLDESILTYVPNADEGAGAGHGGYWAITFKGQWEKKTNSYTAYILWLDDTDNDGVRPKTVDLFLTENSTDTMVDETKVSVTNQHRIAAGETITINGKNYVSDGNNVWSYTWKDLPITWEDTTTNYVYSLYVAGEDSQYGDYSYGIDNVTSRWCGTVVMTHKLITRNVDVQAVWDDQSDNDKLRPDSITFSLYARDSANSGFKKLTDTKYTIALSGSGNVWNYTFTDLPRFKDGYEIQYSIRPNEANVETAAGDLNQYTVDYKTDAIMYLKHGNITQDVTGTVIWNDDSNRDGHRPDSIKIQLYKDGVPYLLNGEAVYATLTKNGNNTWTYTFNGVEQMADGNMSHYSIRVVDINDINATIATNDGVENAYRADYSAMTVVLSHEICRSDVVSRVNWNDNSDQDGIRPDSIKVELYANGEKVPGDDYTVTISEAGNVWVHTFGDMPEYTKGEEGKEIVYTIKVLEVNKDELYGRYILTGNQLNQNKVKYTASYEAKEPIATLTHELDTTTVTLAIEWGDNNNNDNSRPDRVLVSLYKSIDGTNWTLVNDNYVLTARNGWNHTVDSLPKYSDGGREVQYKIALNPGQTFVQENGGTYAASSTGTLLRLVRDASLTYVTARVDWQDSDNQDQLRPGSLGLQLFAKYGNAEPVLVDNSMMVVSADTDWKATWTALPLMKNGSYVEYSVRVVEIPDGYEPLYGAEESDPTSPAPNNRLLVQMIHDQKLEKYTVNVVWNDNSNNGGKRPSELPIALYANGVLVTGTNVKLTTDNAVEGNTDTWSYTFENLPVNAAGKPIDYTVKIYGAYSNSNLYSELTAGLTLYMSMEPIQQNLNLKFFFEDNNNADGSRPTRIKLTLLANGEVVTNDDQEPITITNPNAETTDAFYNLPVYSTGTTKISYGVLVEMVTGGDGYSYTVYGNG